MEKTKLAVTQTVMGALSYGWKNKLTTLRLMWLGFLIYLVIYIGGIFLLVGEAFLESSTMDPSNPDAVADYLAVQGTTTVISMLAALALVPFYVVMYRIASGSIEAPSGFGYFKFGGREVRFVIGYLVIFLVSILALAIIFAPAGISMALAYHTMEANGGGFPPLGFVSILLAIAGIVAMVWFGLRFATFLPAVAIEDRLVLMRSFRMTAGNVWRILGANLLMMVMFMGIIIGVYLGVIIVA